MRLKDKVTIITGSGGGIGRASALLFAREGAKVVVSDLNEKAGLETLDLIRKESGQAVFIRADASVAKDAENLAEMAIGAYGRIDVLFNNAGTSKLGRLTDITEGDWDFTIDTELKSVWLCTKYALPKLIQGGGGSVINMASIAGLIGVSDRGAHSAAKAGVIALTRVTAVEYGKSKIRANAICPGVIKTEQAYRRLEDPRFLASALRSHIVGRLGEPEDVALIALYLASDESAFMTGSVLTIDGGVTAH